MRSKRKTWCKRRQSGFGSGRTQRCKIGARGYSKRYITRSSPASFVFNGRLFSARAAEARLRAQAADQSLRDEADRIARDVRVASLNVNTAYQRLGLTAQLLSEATEALDLAQARYRLGWDSIVELSQAQLNWTQAQTENAGAKYDYQITRVTLDYQIGAWH